MQKRIYLIILVVLNRESGASTGLTLVFVLLILSFRLRFLVARPISRHQVIDIAMCAGKSTCERKKLNRENFFI
jgi:hypothetical protein